MAHKKKKKAGAGKSDNANPAESANTNEQDTAREHDTEKDDVSMSTSPADTEKPENNPVKTQEKSKSPSGKVKSTETAAPSGIAAATQFLQEVRHEGRKITWPDRKQVGKETLSVIVLVTFITFLVLGYDYALGKFVFGPIEHYAKLRAKPKSFDQLTPLAPGTLDLKDLGNLEGLESLKDIKDLNDLKNLGVLNEPANETKPVAPLETESSGRINPNSLPLDDKAGQPPEQTKD